MRDHTSGGTANSFLLGAAMGAAFALLFAPLPGRDTRRMLVDRLRRLRGIADDLEHDIRSSLDKAVTVVREGAPQVEAAVNEGFGTFQSAVRAAERPIKRF